MLTLEQITRALLNYRKRNGYMRRLEVKTTLCDGKHASVQAILACGECYAAI